MKIRIIIVASLVFLSRAIICSDTSSLNMPLTSNKVMARGGYYEMQEPITLHHGASGSQIEKDSVIQILAHADEQGSSSPKMFTIRYSCCAHREYDLEESKRGWSLESGTYSFNFGPQSAAERESYERELQSAKTSWAARTATLRKHFQTTRIPESPEVTAELFRSKLVVVHGSSHVSVHPCTFVEQEEDPCSLCSIS